MARGRMIGWLLGGWLGLSASAWSQPLPSVPVPVQQVAAPPAANEPLPPQPFAGPGPGPMYAPPPCPPDVSCPPDEVTADPGTNFSVSADYLLWYTKRANLQPIVTAGRFSDPIPGALGQRGTQTLLDNEGNTFQNHGFRLKLGYNFDPEWLYGIEGSFFLLESGNIRNVFSSSGANGSLVVARPFYNVNLGVEDADPIAVPNVMSGSVTVEQPSRMYGADVNLRLNYIVDRSQGTRLTFLAGFRWLWLDETLRIQQESQDLPGLGVVGNRISLRETFGTTNDFYGGQFGVEAEKRVGSVVLRGSAKLALGPTRQQVKREAFLQIVEGDGRVTRAADRALLIQPSNAGVSTRDKFTAIPEFYADVGYEFNEHVRIMVGYNLLFWNRVLRPSGSIDRAINIQALQPFDQIGIARPAPVFNTESFWVQGLSARLEFAF